MSNSPQQSLAEAQQSNPRGLSSVKDLIVESWELLLKSALSLFILDIIGLAAYVVLGMVSFAALFGLAANLGILQGNFKDIPSKLTSLPQETYILAGAILVLLIIGFIVVSIVIQIASIIALDQSGKVNYGSTIKRSIQLIIPLFLTSFLVLLVNFGGFFVFVIPSIIFSFLFSFVIYEVILENKSWTGALRRSVAIVSHNFGSILIRLLLLIGINIAVQFIPNMVYVVEPVTGFILSLFSILISILLSWYGMAYILILYKQARAAVSSDAKGSLLWIVIVAILGWVIFGGLLVAGYKVVSSGIFNKYFENNVKQGVEKRMSYRKEPATFALETFEEINKLRSGKGLSALELDSDLCAYAQRRLEQLRQLGRLDDYKGFKEDTVDGKVLQAYFSSHRNIGESDYFPVTDATTPNFISHYFGDSKSENAVNAKVYDRSCVRMHDKFLVIVSAKSK